LCSFLITIFPLFSSLFLKNEKRLLVFLLRAQFISSLFHFLSGRSWSSTGVGFGWELGDQHRAFIGMERMKRYMPMRSFKEMGIVASGNADWSVCSANPMEGIHVCVNRTSETGQDLSQNQAISVMDALRVYTWNGAYITHEEGIKGSIEPGKYADIVVLDTDILECDPEDIVKTKVLTTIIDGKVVYERE
jgi:predicted amidohydrolase YtcJ